MRHLPDILALHRNLVKRFQNVSELTGTIEEFLNTQNAGTGTIWEVFSPVHNGRENVSCACMMGVFYVLYVLRSWA